MAQSQFAAEIGARIAYLRGERSQRQFGRELGLGATAIYRYETGMQVPRADVLILISDLEGVTVDWILRGNEAYRRMRRRKERTQRAQERSGRVG